MKDTIIYLNAASAAHLVKDSLFILFHDDIFHQLVFEITIDCWNIKMFCDNAKEEMLLLVKNRLDKHIDKSELEKHEIYKLIISTAEAIFYEIGYPLSEIIPANTSHLSFVSIDDTYLLTLRAISLSEEDVWEK